MLYPVYVHKDEGSAYGITFPDFPGCFSAADSVEELPQMIQEAVETHFEGEAIDIPKPSDLEVLKDNPEYVGGVWLLAEIDLNRISTRSMRLNISLPVALVNRIDSYASRHHMSRSRFLAMAAEKSIH